MRKDPGTGRIHTYHDVWDFNKIRGCECDYGFFGPGCTQRHCPFGDDPLTGRGNDIDLVAGGDPANEQFNEVQTIYCRAAGGKFTLAFRGFVSEYFMFSDSAEPTDRPKVNTRMSPSPSALTSRQLWSKKTS